MKKVTHVLITSKQVKEANPYYSSNNSRIESEFIDVIKQQVSHFYSNEEVIEYVRTNPSILLDKTAAFYKVQLVNPRIQTLVSIEE